MLEASIGVCETHLLIYMHIHVIQSPPKEIIHLRQSQVLKTSVTRDKVWTFLKIFIFLSKDIVQVENYFLSTVPSLGIDLFSIWMMMMDCFDITCFLYCGQANHFVISHSERNTWHFNQYFQLANSLGFYAQLWSGSGNVKENSCSTFKLLISWKTLNELLLQEIVELL